MTAEQRSFDMSPYFEQHVFFCTNERSVGHKRGSCARKNSIGLRDYMKNQVKTKNIKNVRINTSGCLDRCELGPTLVIYPAGIWYQCNNKEDVDRIISQHLQAGDVVKDLVLTHHQVTIND